MITEKHKLCQNQFGIPFVNSESLKIVTTLLLNGKDNPEAPVRLFHN